MSQSSQTETKGDDLRGMIQKSLDSHRRLMEEIERLETATDDVNKASTVLEEEVRQVEEMLKMKNIQLQSVYDEIKTTRRSVERLNHSCASTKQQCATLERQLRQDISTISSDAGRREKAASQAEQMVERAHAMFDSADWVVEVKRRLEELNKAEGEIAKAQEELDEAEKTRDELQAFINEQNELPFEEFVVSVAAMRLENDAIWAQVGQHITVIKRLELKNAEMASDDGFYEDVQPEQPSVVKAQEQKVPDAGKQPPKVNARQEKVAEPSEQPPKVWPTVVEQEKQPMPPPPPPPAKLIAREHDVIESHQPQEMIEPIQSLVVNVGDQDITDLDQSQEMMEPAQSLVVNIGEEVESEQLLLLDDGSELIDQSISIDAAGTPAASQDVQGSSAPLRTPMVRTAADLSSSQLLVDPLNESQADLGGSFMAMFGFNNSHESISKGGSKAVSAFGFGFGGLDASDQQADGSGKKDDGGVPFSLFGF